MKRLTYMIAAFAGLGLIAAAPATEPVKLTKAQLDKIVAGNGSHPGSSGPNGNNGHNSPPPPGQVTSPPPPGLTGG